MNFRPNFVYLIVTCCFNAGFAVKFYVLIEECILLEGVMPMVSSRMVANLLMDKM